MIVAGFKEMLMTPENSPGRSPKKDHISKLQPDPKSRLSAPDLDNVVQPVLKDMKSSSESKASSKGFMTTGHRAKIRKALMRFNFIPGPRNVSR